VTDVAEPPTERLDAAAAADPPAVRESRLFPGDRTTWRWAGGAILALGVVLLVALLIPR
jgi:hypothetical protein